MEYESTSNGRFDDAERTSLLQHNGVTSQVHIRQSPAAPIAWRLYLSHFLSTWNSRVFEFGAVLYLATIFPGTLLPLSIYALVRGISAIIFAPAIGWYIDTANRLQVVRVSIVVQRVVVSASCIVFYILAAGVELDPGVRVGLLVVLTFFACVEKLCSILNMVSVEKDWVVVIGQDSPEILKSINAQMRRIDLFCKLFGPLFIALIDGYSSQTAIILNFAMNSSSIIVEYVAIAQVYHKIPELQIAKARSHTPNSPESEDAPSEASAGWFGAAWRQLGGMLNRSIQDFELYFKHRAFLPSMAGAILYLTVLSFSGQMVTYLISVSYSSLLVGIGRAVGVFFEVAATWVAPWLMGRIGVVRAGLWMSGWHISTLMVGFSLFWMFGTSNQLVSAGGLVGGTILSRLGLRGFDLCVQLIVQEEVEAENRGAFSSVEAAWQNAFELLAYLSTIVFSRPDQFKWPSLVSVLAVALANVTYFTFAYRRRGHLLPRGFSKFSSTQEQGAERTG